MRVIKSIIQNIEHKVLPCCILMAILLFTFPYISLAYEKAINNLSALMAEKIANSGKKTIAVVDFTDLQGNVTELGRFLAEEFSASLADTGKGFEVVDRTHLKSIIKEHKLSASGLIDLTTARKLGKIVGVEALVTGTITPFGESVRVVAKVLVTDTAKVISTARGNIAKTRAIEELLARGIESSAITTESVAAISPIKRATGKAVEAEGFLFKPLKCIMSGSKVICTISFVNNGNEEKRLRFLTIRKHQSYLYDNFGNQYPVAVQIGDDRIGPGIRNSSFYKRFIPQLPLNVKFTAEAVPKKATHVTMAINASPFRNFVVVRNIPIIK